VRWFGAAWFGEGVRRFRLEHAESLLLARRLLGNTRKTVAVSAAPPKGLACFFPPWRRASAPFALLSNLIMTTLVPRDLHSGAGVAYGWNWRLHPAAKIEAA